MKPVRIQRKRTKGWKMPENTVSVTRPGKWGNPFKIGEYVKIGDGRSGGVSWMWLRALGAEYADKTFTLLDTAEKVIEAYRTLMTRYPRKDLGELSGKNLACFCKEGTPCHADVLLELANSVTTVHECDATKLNSSNTADNQK